MYNNLATASSLDQEYLELLQDIKPYITCIINKHYLGLIKVWMERLSNEDFGQKYLRNSYLQRLYKQLEAGVLEYPFIDIPPEGELLCISEDEEDSFHAAKEALSAQSVRYKCPTQGQGDVPMVDTAGARKPADDESSWLDVSDYSSGKASYNENKQERQKVLDQLRYENTELKKRLNQNDAKIAVNENLNEKIIELQKQLANTMIHNVELQKNVQTIQDERDQFQTVITKQHQKELEILGAQCEQTLAEREETVKQIIDKFTKKYQALRDRYMHKIAEQERSFQIKCTVYKQKISEMKALYEEQAAQLKQKQANDATQLESYELKLQKLHEEHQEAIDSVRRAQDKKMEELRAEGKHKLEAQMTQYKKRLEEEKGKHLYQSAEAHQQHQAELQHHREKHQKLVNDLRAKFQKDLQEQRDNNHLNKDLADHREQCVSLTKQNMELLEANKELTQKLDDSRKQYQEQLTQLQSQIGCLSAENQKQLEQQKAANQLHIDEQCTAYQQQLDELKNMHQQTLAEQKDAHHLEIRQHQRSYMKHHMDRHKMLNKVQMNFIEHKRVLEGQISELHKMEMMWREELLRVLDVVKKLRADKEKSKAEKSKAEKEVAHLRDMVNKVSVLHHKTEKEYCRKFKKLSLEFHLRENKYRVMLSAKATSPTKMKAFDDIINKLEEKYKRSLNEQYETTGKAREKFMKRITELELQLGLNLLQEVNNGH